jgi:transcriptional regulator with PAS, ATPase and Fis domain
MKIFQSYEIFSDVSFIFLTEKQHIEHILEVTDGNRTGAAKILAIALTTLQRKLRVFAESTIRRK